MNKFIMLKNLFIVFMLLVSGSVYAMTETQFYEFEVEDLHMGMALKNIQQVLQDKGFTLDKMTSGNKNELYFYSKKLQRNKAHVNLTYTMRQPNGLLTKMVIKMPNLDKTVTIKKAKLRILNQLPNAIHECKKLDKAVNCNFQAYSNDFKLSLNIVVNNQHENYKFERKYIKSIPTTPSPTTPSPTTPSPTTPSPTTPSPTTPSPTTPSPTTPSPTTPSPTTPSPTTPSPVPMRPPEPSLEERANNGDAQAQYQMGLKYEKRGGSSSENQEAYKKAAEWYQKAADQGHKKAQLKLAQMYEEGKGVRKNQQKAIDLLKKYADEGNAEAAFALGMHYLTGRGVEQDDEQAFKWFQQAAEWGHKQSSYNVAMMYEKGLGTKIDIDKAKEWYSKAAKSGPTKSEEHEGDQGGTSNDSNNYTISVTSDKVPY